MRKDFTLPATSPILDRLVFVWWSDDFYGALLTAERYEFLHIFRQAGNDSETWGQFTEALGPTWTEYVGMFMCDENGEIVKPSPEDHFGDLPDLFIFFDEEFPLVQCVQETYQEFENRLPTDLGYAEYMTEFGMPLRLFKKSRFVELKESLASVGIQVESHQADFPMSIYDYKHGRKIVHEG